MYTLNNFLKSLKHSTLVKVYEVNTGEHLFTGSNLPTSCILSSSFIEYAVVEVKLDRTHLDIYISEIPEVFSDIDSKRVTFGRNDFYDAELTVIDNTLGLRIVNDAATAEYTLSELRVTGGTKYVIELEVV